ncbi:MAG: hypothetical protein ACREJK_11865, partial [Candidatus Methylomirabilales bacterium]
VEGGPTSLPAEALAGTLPRITCLLVLGHRIEAMIRSGEIQDLAEAARVIGITKARVTQITNLTLLAPAIQENVLALPRGQWGREIVTEREVRSLTARVDWECQQRVWAGFRARLPRCSFPSRREAHPGVDRALGQFERNSSPVPIVVPWWASGAGCRLRV